MILLNFISKMTVNSINFIGQHRFCWRMLQIKFVGDKFLTLMTVWPFSSTTSSIEVLPLTLTSGNDIQKTSSISKFLHQCPKIVTNINVACCNWWIDCADQNWIKWPLGGEISGFTRWPIDFKNFRYSLGDFRSFLLWLLTNFVIASLVYLNFSVLWC